MQLPSQRWRIFPSQPILVSQLVTSTGLSSLMAQVLINRGINTAHNAHIYLQPENQKLPLPIDEFVDLPKSVLLLKEAILSQQAIAICGDYDADGMTSTALLLRAIRHLGGKVQYDIPSRMSEGYGINNRIVEEFAQQGVGLILTVDNGISAYEPVARAKELGVKVIITDHHDLPEILPPANAILNPKMLAQSSPYRGLAGVGVAYILAVTTAQSLNNLKGLTEQLLELFTLGTIADLAPLVGINRRWLKRGLRRLPQSKIIGVQALMVEAGVNEQQKQLKPDDIGFKLGPRINAIGRIDDPQVVIKLLTTEDREEAKQLAQKCEEINRLRQTWCTEIEAEAIDLIENTPIRWQQDCILVLSHSDWHHGVIGIVASRLVDRYGVPVFICTEEEDEPDKLRGSARGTDEFHVFKALEFCHDLLGKYGGHQKAGGFGLLKANLPQFKRQLSLFSRQCLELEVFNKSKVKSYSNQGIKPGIKGLELPTQVESNHDVLLSNQQVELEIEALLKPLIKVDVRVDFAQLNEQLYQEIDSLQPWGIENDFPVFWTDNVKVLEQKILKGNHLKLTVTQTVKDAPVFKAIAWRWGDYYPLPNYLDIAYKLQKNTWQGITTIELEMVGVRLPTN